MPQQTRRTSKEELKLRLMRGLFAALAALLVLWLLDLFVYRSFHAAKITLVSDRPQEVKLYYTAGSPESFREKKSTPLVLLEKGEKKVLTFFLGGAEIKNLRLDPGVEPGRLRLYEITLHSYFGPTLRLGPDYPGADLRSNAELSVVQQDQYLALVSAGHDPFLIFANIPRLRPGVEIFILPGLAALLIFLYLPLEPRQTAVWRDTFDRRPSSGVNYDALDGLRGLAALFVLASHAGVPGCKSLGIVGVVIFFVLSGFLLVMPYAADSARVLSFSYLKGYFARRLRRIVPMYYFYILVGYFFAQRLGEALRTAFFLQGNNILWTVLQEMHFYLLLPLVLLLNHLLFRGNNARVFIFLAFLGQAFSLGLLETHRMYGNGASQPLYAAIFLAGMAASYLNASRLADHPRLAPLLANAWVTSLLFLLLPGAGLLGAALHGGQFQNPMWLLKSYYCYGIALFVLTLVRTPKALLKRFLASPFLRLMGTISYSFYLLHPACLLGVKEFMIHATGHQQPGLVLFLPSLLLTFVVSAITYTLIERPFIRSNSAVSQKRLEAGK